MQAQKSQTPIICSMGAGNKMDPTAFEVTDIYKTSVCPLARVMRYELKNAELKTQGCLFKGKAACTNCGYGDKLPRALHLPSRYGEKFHTKTCDPRQ